MAANAPKLTYSIPEVCEALQISRTTLWKLVRSRRLKPVRIGRRVLFSLKAVDAVSYTHLTLQTIYSV